METNCEQVIKESVAGLGTDEDSLTRAIVARAEIDMVRVKEQYHLLYKCSLEADVIDDTSGDYKDFLMTLLGKGIWYIFTYASKELNMDVPKKKKSVVETAFFKFM